MPTKDGVRAFTLRQPPSAPLRHATSRTRDRSANRNGRTRAEGGCVAPPTFAICGERESRGTALLNDASFEVRASQIEEANIVTSSGSYFKHCFHDYRDSKWKTGNTKNHSDRKLVFSEHIAQ